MSFWSGIFRNIMFYFDQIIYGFIPTVYNFIMDLARITIFDFESLQRIANNVYGVLGLFLIFRVAFILLNAIIDPDKLTNKDTGVAKILSKVIISLALIAIIPWGFQAAFQLQKSILENSVIERLILGRSTSEAGSAVTNSGEYLGELSLRAFLTCDKNIDPISCDNLDLSFSEAFPQGVNNTKANFTDLANNLNQTTVADGKQAYTYDYRAGLSTICGGVILFMLISFCFDIAIRSVKLGFLQMITPLAVVGYIEPKGDIFKNWLKMSISTYVNLFIRILAISFVTFTLSSLSNNLGVIYGNDLEGTTKTFAYIFVILGLLIFAKQLPNMLSSLIPGMKEASLGSLNPFKRLGDVAGAGLIGGAAAVGAKVAGTVGGGISGAYYAGKAGGSRLAGFGQGSKAGFNNIKMKDATKGGIAGIGKSLYGGTFGAFNKGGAYAKGKVTGKEEKVGVINWAKQGMEKTGVALHQEALRQTDLKEIADLKEKAGITAADTKGSNRYSMYGHSDYGDTLKKIDIAKDALKARENEHSRIENIYRNNPSNQQAYQNYVDSIAALKKYQSNLEYNKKQLDEMEKLSIYKDDVELHSLYEKVQSEEKARKIATDFSGNTNPPQSDPIYSKFDNGTIDLSSLGGNNSGKK